MTEPAVKSGAAQVETPRPFWSVVRCPMCGHDGMTARRTSTRCPICQREYPIERGVVDLAAPSGRDGRNVTQRVMESRFYARFYEDVMRPRLTNAVSDRTLPQEYRLAAQYLELSQSHAILDVACGTANFTRHFARELSQAGNPAELIGADMSWPMLEVAREKLRRDGLEERVHLLRANAARLPLKTGAFDRVHCAGALHMMEDIDGALREFARLLEPQGICVIGTFVTGRGLVRKLVKRVAEIPTHFHWFTPRELERRLVGAGLRPLATNVQGDAITIKAIRQS